MSIPVDSADSANSSAPSRGENDSASRHADDPDKMAVAHPEPDGAQRSFGAVCHGVTMAACLMALAAPVLALCFPDACRLHPNLTFGALFSGKNLDGIWLSAGNSSAAPAFWPTFLEGLAVPDGLALAAIALGSSVTLWALAPAAWHWRRKGNRVYAGLALLVMGLVALAMSGLVHLGAG